jgi:DNA-binding PadR family transcriptional regulator
VFGRSVRPDDGYNVAGFCPTTRSPGVGFLSQMNESTYAGTDARTDGDGPTAKERCDLTKFQLRVLGVLSSAENEQDNLHGLGVKERLEAYYGTEVNHGRLYPNLDTLVEQGLVERGSKDRRTNWYAISGDGRVVLTDEVAWLVERTPGLSVVPPAEEEEEEGH